MLRVWHSLDAKQALGSEIIPLKDEGGVRLWENYEKLSSKKAMFLLCFNIGEEHKTADFNQVMTTVSPIMWGRGLRRAWSMSLIRFLSLPSNEWRKIRQLCQKKADKWRPTQILCLAGCITIGPCYLLSQYYNPREMGKWAEERPTCHFISPVWVAEVAPAFCFLPGREPTIPVWRHLSPAVHIAEQQLPRPRLPLRFLADSRPSPSRYTRTQNK